MNATTNITHGFDAYGGFFVVDHDTRRAAYAYPSSPHATRARKKAHKERIAVVNEMTADFGKPLATGPLNDSGVSMASIAEEHYVRIAALSENGG